ncbi:GDSL-type esterase/lipase family protein [Novosphingobium sp.]|uniref:GDSL-type esterase/lipase family protein n=1 Tax=Novosphingobium sp. TaxID=1874826 RepID=UPI0038BAE763
MISASLMPNRRNLLKALAVVAPACAAAPAFAQSATGTATPPAPPCPVETPDNARAHTDFAWLSRYADDNRKLLASDAQVRIVFMGDSITQGWRDKDPDFFPEGRINRGIGGQTTPQMLLRMMADVIALRPRAVHIMAGTNDIASNTGPMTAQMTRDNLAAMATLAKANGITVLLASIPPAANYPWRLGLDTMSPIAAHNVWLRDYAAANGHVWVDYHPALAGPDGGMRPGFAVDGVHPTPDGYAAMNAVLLPILQKLRVA